MVYSVGGERDKSVGRSEWLMANNEELVKWDNGGSTYVLIALTDGHLQEPCGFVIVFQYPASELPIRSEYWKPGKHTTKVINPVLCKRHGWRPRSLFYLF